MRVLPGGAREWPVVSTAIVLAASAMFSLPMLAGLPAEAVTVAAATVVSIVAFRDALLQWRSLLTLLVLIILFVPIRRYILPGHLPFQLEPYRILIALILAAWFTSLLIDPRIHLRKSGLEGPLLLFLAAAFASILLNGGRVTPGPVDSNVIKSLTFLLSFVLLIFVLVSVVGRDGDVVFLLKVLVVGGSVLAFFAVIESRTHFNPFDHLSQYVPFLKQNYGVAPPKRLGKFRAYGSAEHPIALSAALAMMVPLAGYFAYTLRRRRWWFMAGLLTMGCLATVSRTGVLILVTEALVFVILRPQQMKRAWPALVPLLLVLHIALPGTLGTLRSSFFPQGGLLQEQQGYKATGRFGAARLDPTFAQINSNPLFGIGFGTRITGSNNLETNALTLDDQWLGTVLETGIVGAFAWVWLLVRIVRRLCSAARRDQTERGWLLTAIAASLVGYSVGMITFDAFSFVQVTFVFYILLGLGASLVAPRRRAETMRAPAPTYASAAAGAYGLGVIVLAVALVLFTWFQGPSIQFLVLVIVLLTLGAIFCEKSFGDRSMRTGAESDHG